MTVLCQTVWFWIPIASVKLCNHSFSVFLSPSGQMQASADQNDLEASTLASLSICLGVLLDVRVDFDLGYPVERN